MTPRAAGVRFSCLRSEDGGIPWVGCADALELARSELAASGGCELESAPAATDEQLALVHDPSWIARLKAKDLSPEEEKAWSMPRSKDILGYSWKTTGATIAACRRALQERLGVALGGGWHHAFASHGEGFCPVNDLAVAVRVLQGQGSAVRPMIVDLDAHQGNGTARIFREDPGTFTFSMHNREIYPDAKEAGSLDIELNPDTGDEEYLEVLGRHLPGALERHRPDFVLYLAGADPYALDGLGGLSLSRAGLRRRDAYVCRTVGALGLPLAVVVGGGGYCYPEDLKEIRLASIAAAFEAVVGARRRVFA